MAFDDALVARVALDAVVTLATLRELGATKEAIAYRVKAGDWARPHREVYVVRELVRHRVRTMARAALLAAPDGAVASHVLGAYLRGLEGLPELIRPAVSVDLTSPPRRIAGLDVHRYAALEGSAHRGLPVTPVSRLVADLACCLSEAELLSVVDSALHQRKVTSAQLAQRVLIAGRARGSRRLRRVVALADGRSDSPLESRLRLLLLEAGFEFFELQVPVTCGGTTYRIDIGFPSVRLGIEADGRDVHSTPQALFADRRRQNALQVQARWLILRFTWEDVVYRPEYVIDEVRRGLAAQAVA